MSLLIRFMELTAFQQRDGVAIGGFGTPDMTTKRIMKGSTIFNSRYSMRDKDDSVSRVLFNKGRVNSDFVHGFIVIPDNGVDLKDHIDETDTLQLHTELDEDSDEAVGPVGKEITFDYDAIFNKIDVNDPTMHLNPLDKVKVHHLCLDLVILDGDTTKITIKAPSMDALNKLSSGVSVGSTLQLNITATKGKQPVDVMCEGFKAITIARGPRMISNGVTNIHLGECKQVGLYALPSVATPMDEPVIKLVKKDELIDILHDDSSQSSFDMSSVTCRTFTTMSPMDVVEMSRLPRHGMFQVLLRSEKGDETSVYTNANSVMKMVDMSGMAGGLLRHLPDMNELKAPKRRVLIVSDGTKNPNFNYSYMIPNGFDDAVVCPSEYMQNIFDTTIDISEKGYENQSRVNGTSHLMVMKGDLRSIRYIDDRTTMSDFMKMADDMSPSELIGFAMCGGGRTIIFDREGLRRFVMSCVNITEMLGGVSIAMHMFDIVNATPMHGEWYDAVKNLMRATDAKAGEVDQNLRRAKLYSPQMILDL